MTDKFNIIEIPYGSEQARNQPQWELIKDVKIHTALSRSAASHVAVQYVLSEAGEEFDYDVIGDHVGSFEELKLLDANSSGYVNHSFDPYQFFFSTPDDDRPAWVYVAKALTRANGSTLVQGMVGIDKNRIKRHKPLVPLVDSTWKGSVVPLILMPATFLRMHVEETRQALGDLISEVEKAESSFGAEGVGNLSSTMTGLRDLNKRAINLERRWRFQTVLARSIVEFLDHFEDQKDKIEFKRLRDQTDYYTRATQSSDYDLNGLSRRIENLFSTTHNLTTAKLAEATLHDSSSMKTIAMLTLIFLPATFVCAFFSMEFFNWKIESGSRVSSSLWLYFAVMVPLTIVIVLSWLLCTRRTRKRMGNLLGRSAGKSKRKTEGVEKIV